MEISIGSSLSSKTNYMYKQNLISQTSNICKLYSIFSIQSGSKILFNANESGCKF